MCDFQRPPRVCQRDLEHGGAWRPRAPAAPLGSPGARRSSPSVSGPGAPRLSSAYRPSTAYSSLTSNLEPSPHDLLQGGRPHEATSWGEGSCPALACRWGHSSTHACNPLSSLADSAGGPRGALRYGDDALPASLTPSSCRLHPGASPPAPLVCPAGAPPGISGIRVRAARATVTHQGQRSSRSPSMVPLHIRQLAISYIPPVRMAGETW